MSNILYFHEKFRKNFSASAGSKQNVLFRQIQDQKIMFRLDLIIFGLQHCKIFLISLIFGTQRIVLGMILNFLDQIETF